MKKFIAAIFTILIILALAAAGICLPVYFQWKEIRENLSFEAEFTLDEDDGAFYKAAKMLGLSSGRLEGYDCGGGLYYVQLWSSGRDKPGMELYITPRKPEDSYINLTTLGNTAVAYLGESLPLLQGFLKEWDTDRYVSLGQLEEITGMELPLEEILQAQEKLLPYTKLLPLLRLLPSAYQENGYRYYQFPEISKQLTVGLSDSHSVSRGVSVLLDLEAGGTTAHSQIWLSGAAQKGKTAPAREELVSDEEIRLIREFFVQWENLLL